MYQVKQSQMADIKIHRTRAQSAKTYHENKRPFSSKPKPIQKSEAIQKIYSQMPFVQDKNTTFKNKTRINSVKLNNKSYNNFHPYVQKQAVFEENMQLKKKIHNLEEQLTHTVSRVEAVKSKNSKINKNLNIQFQNQTLWAGKSSYLITGVKNQYQNLKIKYKQKCNQLQTIKNQNIQTAVKQLKKQNQILKSQNFRLIKKLVQQQNRHNMLLSSNPHAKNSVNQKKVNEYLISELQEKVMKLETQIRKRNQQIVRYRSQLTTQISTIKFFEKLINQKDNSLHSFNKKNKRLEKQKTIFAAEIAFLKTQIEKIKSDNIIQIQQMKQVQQKKINYERQIYHKTIQQKTALLQKTEKEVAYLTTLLSYWKPLDEENDEKNSAKKQKINNQLKLKEEEQKKKQAAKQAQSFDLAMSFLGKMSGQFTQSQVNQIMQNSNQPKQQKRADKKRNQSSKKVRNVRESQVQQIGELLRFRLIAQRISIEEAKNQFSFKKNSNVPEQEYEWNTQYINMKQVRETLRKMPFNLSEEQSHFLSRYLIEDAIEDYIYCDDENQNKRGIVKSIFKHIVGQYTVDKNMSLIESETNIELGKYKSKISTILQQMYPGGLISKKKLLQIFVGSGFEIQIQIMEFIIGKIAIKSQSLSNMNYGVLL